MYNEAMELFNVRNLILIILLIVGINYYKSTQEINAQNLSLPLDTKILAFGDSLTYGYGVTRDKNYPTMLGDILHVNVINEGINGEMSEQGLARLSAALARHKPDILVLCHGGNDILRKKDLTQTKNNLNAMVKMAKEKGVYVLLVGVPTFDILNFNVPSFYYEVAKEMALRSKIVALKKLWMVKILNLTKSIPMSKATS